MSKKYLKKKQDRFKVSYMRYGLLDLTRTIVCYTPVPVGKGSGRVSREHSAAAASSSSEGGVLRGC